MTDNEQKRIFASNLNYYIALNKKTQKEVAKDIKETPTTINNWCKQVSMPSVGKIQKLADYFRIGKSDLTDENPLYSNESAKLNAKIFNDKDLQSALALYFQQDSSTKQKIIEMINLLCEK